MIVLVCGDRNWSNRIRLNAVLSEEHANNLITLLVEGEAPGADTMGRDWAETREIPVSPFPAQWRKFGRAAGPIRNTQMLDEGQPDFVIAFHNDLENSKGTRNMVDQAMKRDIPVRIVKET